MYVEDLIMIGFENYLKVAFQRGQLLVKLLLGDDAINQDKLSPPSHFVSFLGWDVNFQTQELVLSASNRRKMASRLFPPSLKDWVSGTPTKQMFQSLFGGVVNASSGRSLAKSHTFGIRDVCSLISESSTVAKVKAISHLAFADIQWWRSLFDSSRDDPQLSPELLSHSFDVHSHFLPSQADVFIFTDASMSRSGGVVRWIDQPDPISFQYDHSPQLMEKILNHLEEKSDDPEESGVISYLEAMAVISALHFLQQDLQGMRVFFFVDNFSVVSWMGTTKTPPSKARFFVEFLSNFSHDFNTSFEREWIPTKLNFIADTLSRSHVLHAQDLGVNHLLALPF